MPKQNEAPEGTDAQLDPKEAQSERQSSLEYSRAVQKAMVRNQFLVEELVAEVKSTRTAFGEAIELLTKSEDMDTDRVKRLGDPSQAPPDYRGRSAGSRDGLGRR